MGFQKEKNLPSNCAIWVKVSMKLHAKRKLCQSLKRMLSVEPSDRCCEHDKIMWYNFKSRSWWVFVDDSSQFWCLIRSWFSNRFFFRKLPMLKKQYKVCRENLIMQNELSMFSRVAMENRIETISKDSLQP